MPSSVLPSSLSPHICVLSSPDLSQLLTSSSLPPLPKILQSFSPLPQVTTRTTTLTSVPHASFALRFSDLLDIETACREDEEQRAVRTIDWITARINSRCAKWIDDVQNVPDKDNLRTPWWDELRRCAEGEHVPSKHEGWNHPVAIILAVSTTAPNPLQAITALHLRTLDFPPWVDTTLFRYTLIVHPNSSPLSNEEAGALFNAVKKQYGLHSYLLPLMLPTSLPAPVPVPALIPRLPPLMPGSSEASNNGDPLPEHTSQTAVHTLKLFETDIQQTARFTREFVVMSLVPWMEKCVLEWNENFSSTRRLPSRLFSSTRRLFGSPSPSPAPSHNVSSSVSSIPSRISYSSSAGSSSIPPPSQQRRLAEFATILGDYKLAVTVWEALRKDGKGGADILPILLSPSPVILAHVVNALTNTQSLSPELPPTVQLQALRYAMRWEAGIPSSDFLGDTLQGERWLVWAAGDSEELPSALLFAHAALLSARKISKRKAALWYLTAANKLEKIGIKPLTMHFLRCAHALYQEQPSKSLSPSFWDSEFHSKNDVSGFDAILPGIEHPLGRLLYTTGDVLGAVKLFAGLLKGSSSLSGTDQLNDKTPDLQGLISDKIFLEDFRVALTHHKATAGDESQLDQLGLPIKFCVARQTRIRLSSDCVGGKQNVWKQREDDWSANRASLGAKDYLEGSRKAVVENFWIDLVIKNPLVAEVTLSNITITLQDEDHGTKPLGRLAEIQIIEQITLAANENRMVSIAIRPLRTATMTMTHVSYDFLSLLPCVESLSYRGRKLQETAAQRQKPTYAPDVIPTIQVAEENIRLTAQFIEEGPLTVYQGEHRHMIISLSNTGKRPISELWVVHDANDELWFNVSQSESDEGKNGVIHSPNCLDVDLVHRLPQIAREDYPLLPGHTSELTVVFHATDVGSKEVSLLLTYREDSKSAFQSFKLSQRYEIQPFLELGASARPSESMEHPYILNLEIVDSTISSVIQISQINTLSATWRCTELTKQNILLYPSQSARLIFSTLPSAGNKMAKETLDFVATSLNNVIHGHGVTARQPPPIDLFCCDILKEQDISLLTPMVKHFIHVRRHHVISDDIAQTHPHIPINLWPAIFPLYHPFSVDIVVLWTIPQQNRSGHVLLPGLMLGGGHGALSEAIEGAEVAKVTRTIYAETQRERTEFLRALKNSEWNIEADPLSVVIRDLGDIRHDFSRGPCCVQIPITLRNHSLTHISKYILRFPTAQEHFTSSSTPSYSGHLTFRGILRPTQSATINPKLWIMFPGSYNLAGWHLETEVYEEVDGRFSDSQRGLRRYLRKPMPKEIGHLRICDIYSA
ncbi:hypothetical protein AMATHDRAFT_135105 [Amanita thiersii Skay4041]|uniref:Uncharacterized protein n=1 Tax=Amanita thiersii Skay4041 TaxID=703135 RepID=A0A2A9P123_9AGAR|nr:hypothetical protein AMATHDRAFT_135105 [Amanita thiersii Skay4041]